MSGTYWLIVGLVIGMFLGVLCMALMVMARDIGPDSESRPMAPGPDAIKPPPTGPCLLHFRGEICGYDGPEQDCDKTFASCRAKCNEARFWG